MQTINFSGKNALVCGATQGIGSATAVLLASLGARVVALARDEQKLIQLTQSLTPHTLGHDYRVADFTQPEEVKQQIQSLTTSQTFHIVVNNTGGPAAGEIKQALPQEFVLAFHQHLICNHIIAQAVLPGMKQVGYGRIINIISTSVKQPLKGLGVSNTIRAAVANWAKTLSIEVAADGITVNNVLPGATETQRLANIIQNKAQKTQHQVTEVREELIAEIPMKRFAQPQEIAQAVAFLASEWAGYITGINLPVDGGRTGCL